jgi:hypothetical protein
MNVPLVGLSPSERAVRRPLFIGPCPMRNRSGNRRMATSALGFMNNPNSRHLDLECLFEMINEPAEPMTCVNILDAHHYAESLSRPSNQSE